MDVQPLMYLGKRQGYSIAISKVVRYVCVLVHMTFRMQPSACAICGKVWGHVAVVGAKHVVVGYPIDVVLA
jgi:hypothetical protein